jgi:hypothetical protein
LLARAAHYSGVFAFAFDYAQQKVPDGIGMATDMTFIPAVSPRFGGHACEGF